MHTVLVAKAARLHEPEIPGVTLQIAGELPPFDGVAMEDVVAYYQREATQVVEALVTTLPQGTMHAVLVTLLSRYGSVYRGPTTDAGPLTAL